MGDTNKMPRGISICFLVATLSSTIAQDTNINETCANAFAKFDDLTDASDADRDIARLKLVPYYERICPDWDWDSVVERLRSMSHKRRRSGRPRWH